MSAYVDWTKVVEKLSTMEYSGGSMGPRDCLTASCRNCNRLVVKTPNGGAFGDEFTLAILEHECDEYSGPALMELDPCEYVFCDDEEREEDEEDRYTGPIQDVATLPDLYDRDIWASATAGTHAGFESLLRASAKKPDTESDN